ncbi:hypothetical protein GYMLUDRAFT_49737 [Collybiopsis luxurians FD-317 M1]|uniref:Uncharacterized protein n=1 Tax=Collybiopsis luxurians FD-317 M1 TaxID=944289 RepID=A0A0D0BTL3_9AGAR|nr:hypothetical protein GYMLUDRAFT_49737 [Collybiopsis luxurians FD-317 M1]
MPTYTLNVLIESEQLKLLKENCYTLCIARKVHDPLGARYTVVWSGTKDFSEDNNVFRWTDGYTVYASKKFQVGDLVEAESNKMSIAYKQECLFDDTGSMQQAKADPKPVDGTFKITNKFGAISFGMSSELNGENHANYISPVIIKGHVVLAPVDEVRVWFALNLLTGTMFSDFTGEYIELQFGGDRTTATVCYDQTGSWQLMGSDPGVVQG